MKNVFILLTFIAVEMSFSQPIVNTANQKITGVEKSSELASRELFATWEPGEPWLEGVSSGEAFGGAIFKGSFFFGSTLLDSDLIPVKIQFSKSDTSIGTVYRRDLGYADDGQGVFYGAAWDMSDKNNPRRLNICMVEWEDGSGAKNANKVWDPDSSNLGGRE